MQGFRHFFFFFFYYYYIVLTVGCTCIVHFCAVSLGPKSNLVIIDLPQLARGVLASTIPTKSFHRYGLHDW